MVVVTAVLAGSSVACGGDGDDDDAGPAANTTDAAGGSGAGGQTATSRPGGGGGNTITISDFAYTAATVAPGAMVAVENKDGVAHTVTADDGGFAAAVSAGASASFSAPDRPGSHPFHCEVHPSMKGTLIVS